MKALILFIALSLCLVSCKKDNNSPGQYKPKVGDTYQSVVSKWGACKDIKYYSKSFNDDGEYKYIERKTMLVITGSKVSKFNKL